MSNDDATKKPKQAVENEHIRAAREAEHIKDLRARLYARVPEKQSVRHTLPQREIHDEFPKTIESPSPVPIRESRVLPSVSGAVTPNVLIVNTDSTVAYTGSMSATKKRKSFRIVFALLGILFFIGALAISSFFMFKGGNTISAENISIEVTGPISVGGGEEVSFKATVANQNTVPIESATLIVEYPQGTQSSLGDNKEISIVRQPLNAIGTGELVNIPLRARVFGAENEEKEIKVSIDYRITGSSATFHKEATPLRFKISTSPVVVTFDAVKSISSGQDIELKLTLQSNSPTPLNDVLVKMIYPDGFDFNQAIPDTLSGEDIWKFMTLKPNEKKVITVKGLITGNENDVRQFTAQVGVASGQDSNTIVSQLATAHTDVAIEQPFLQADVSINGSTDETVIMSNDESASVQIKFINNLDFVIYDGKVEVELSGNALNEFGIKTTDGFYDSGKNTITWDSVDEKTLKEILPGGSASLSFSITPKNGISRTPEVNFKVTARGQRIFENNVSQELVGTASRTLKVESVSTMGGEILYSSGPFTNTGPIPPVAEKVTQYTYSLTVKSGANDIAGTEVTAVIPKYVSWLDLVTPDNSVTYNSVTRTMKWTIGNMSANTEKKVGIQVSFLPSLSQVGTTPTLLEAQRLKATDRFTSTIVRVEHPALTTVLYGEKDKTMQDGNVRASEN